MSISAPLLRGLALVLTLAIWKTATATIVWLRPLAPLRQHTAHSKTAITSYRPSTTQTIKDYCNLQMWNQLLETLIFPKVSPSTLELRFWPTLRTSMLALVFARQLSFTTRFSWIKGSPAIRASPTWSRRSVTLWVTWVSLLSQQVSRCSWFGFASTHSGANTTTTKTLIIGTEHRICLKK